MARVDDRVGSIDRRDRDGARAQADRRRLFSQSVFVSDAVGDLFSATTILENTASNGSASPGAGREPRVEILDLDACVLRVSIPVVHKPMIAARPLTERFAP
jgi:hypothetical protein